jgi:quinohemoprotein ethanol dehydrogenase
MPMAAKTWFGTWWKNGAGGGTAWNAIAYDPDFNRVIFGTGNGYAYNQLIRSEGRGDNLFIASIVAVDANTGRYAWHYQVNPGDQWDFDACNDLTLATLDIGGKSRKVVMQASKNGFFYVIDRRHGELISAAPFAKETWAARIDIKSGRPVENPNARYHGQEPVEMWPSMSGAHTWPPQSFSPQTGLVYIPVIERGMMISDKGVDLANWKPPVNALGGPGVIGNLFADLPGSRRSFLKAWDPVSQTLRWSHETPGDWPAGTMATGGNLMFQGRIDHAFVAYAADTGKILWTFNAESPIVAPPMTYAIGGQQYITVITGSGGAGGGILALDLAPYATEYYSMPRRVLTFALNGKAQLPQAAPPPTLQAPVDPTFQPNPAREERGFAQFHGACAVCHGFLAIGGGGTAPDLRLAPAPLDQAAFESIVHGGALASQGMPQFADLSAEDLEAIRQYIRSRAQALPKHATSAH